MKSSLISIMFVLFAGLSFGQISVDKTYVGLLSATSFSLDSVYSKSTATVRIGSMVSYKFSDAISLHAWGLHETSPTSSWTASGYWMELKPISGLNVEFGNIAGLTTMHRPHPVSDKGQSETWGYAQSPVGSVGIKTGYTFSDKFSASVGVFERKQKADYQISGTYGGLKITGFYTDWNEKYGLVGSYDSKSFSSIIVWKQDALMANTTTVKFGSEKDIWVYADLGYDLNLKEWAHSEFVAVKNFSSKYVKGRIGLGYDTMKNSLNGYLLVYL